MILGGRLEGGGGEARAAATGCLAAGHRGRLSHERGMPTGVGIEASHEAMLGYHAMASSHTIYSICKLDIFNLNPCRKGIAYLRASLHPCIYAY